MITLQGLTKEERLCSRSIISALFREGDSFVAFPYRVIYRVRSLEEGMPPLRMMVSVGKRYHKRAVRRNTVKRRTKEAFRLNKSLCFYSKALPCGVDVCFVYIGKEEATYPTIEHGIRKALQKLVQVASPSGDLPTGVADPTL